MNCPKCEGAMKLRKVDHSRQYIFKFHACRECNLLIASIEYRKNKEEEDTE